MYVLVPWWFKCDLSLCRMFLYIFLGGLVVLMLFGMYQVLETRTVCVLFFPAFIHMFSRIPVLESFNPAHAEEENPSEGGEGHRRDEWRRHQLDSSGDSQCHEYVHSLFQQSLRWEWSCARIWCWLFCLTDKASPKASPRKRTNRAAGADQWDSFLPSLYLKKNQHFWNLVFKRNSALKMFALVQPAEASICSDKNHFNTNRPEFQLVLEGTLSSLQK